MHGAALKIAEEGRPVFPCRPAPDKSPLTRHGFKDASTEQSRINAYWNANHAASIGVPTGERSGVWVLDVDRLEALEELEAKIGPLPPTRTVRTPRGGLHLWFRHVEGITNSPGGLPKGLDVRGEGGYVLVPPSDGYAWEGCSDISEAPHELVELVWEKRPTSTARPRAARGVAGGDPIPEGQRNSTLFFEALELKDAGEDRERALEELEAINAARCVPPLDAGEVEKILKSAFRYPIRGDRTPPEVLEVVDELKRLWWAARWRGVGGKTERDVLRVLIEMAERYGQRVEDGVRVSISWRTLALASASSFRTVSRVVRRLEGWIRPDNAARSGTEAGAFVLKARPTDITLNTLEGVIASDVTWARLPSETPCFRWRGLVGKGRAGVLYALEAFGPQTVEELVGRLGWKQLRDLRSRYLLPLVELGLVEDRSGVYALPSDYRERVEEVRAAPYGGGERKVRHKSEGRWTTSVRYSSPASEIGRERADVKKYADQGKQFREDWEKGEIKGSPGYESRQAEKDRAADAECRELLNELDREREPAGEVRDVSHLVELVENPYPQLEAHEDHGHAEECACPACHYAELLDPGGSAFSERRSA